MRDDVARDQAEALGRDHRVQAMVREAEALGRTIGRNEAATEFIEAAREERFGPGAVLEQQPAPVEQRVIGFDQATAMVHELVDRAGASVVFGGVAVLWHDLEREDIVVFEDGAVRRLHREAPAAEDAGDRIVEAAGKSRLRDQGERPRMQTLPPGMMGGALEDVARFVEVGPWKGYPLSSPVFPWHEPSNVFAPGEEYDSAEKVLRRCAFLNERELEAAAREDLREARPVTGETATEVIEEAKAAARVAQHVIPGTVNGSRLEVKTPWGDVIVNDVREAFRPTPTGAVVFVPSWLLTERDETSVALAQERDELLAERTAWRREVQELREARDRLLGIVRKHAAGGECVVAARELLEELGL